MKPPFWFYRPYLRGWWYGWRALIPFYRGRDEWDRHCLALGWNFTGRIVIPYHQCVDPEIDPDGCPWNREGF